MSWPDIWAYSLQNHIHLIYILVVSKCHVVLLLNSPVIIYQVLDLFPSSQGLEVLWSSVVKIGQSLYREAPGKDPFRPDQKTPVKNFFLAGSYTKQVTTIFLFISCHFT